MAQSDVETLVIDLADVAYVDSAGLSALLLARRQQTAHDGDVRLVGVCDDVRSLLELTQLNRVFPIYASVTEALEAPQLSTIVVPPDGSATGSDLASTAVKTVVAGAGVAALGAIALGDDEDLANADEDDYDDEEDDDFFDDEDEEEGDEESDEDDDEESEESEGDDDEEGYEYEDDLEFDDEEEDDDDEF